MIDHTFVEAFSRFCPDVDLTVAIRERRPLTTSEAQAVETAVAALPVEARAALSHALAAKTSQPWLAQTGPQEVAYHHEAEEMLYGGAAGGGKSDLLIGLATTAHRKSLIFRRQAVDLDGIWDRMLAVLRDDTPESLVRNKNGVKKKLVTQDARLIEMGHLEKQGSEKSWQGRAHDLIGFDEAAQLDENKVNFVTQWLRSTEEGQRCRVVFATNPPIPDMKGGALVDASTGDWLKRWFAPWIDPNYSNPAEPAEIRYCYMVAEGDRLVSRWVSDAGWYNAETGEYWGDGDPTPDVVKTHNLAKARSRTFIKSLVRDNVYLRDSGYVEKLSSTPEPLRSMLMDGDFGVKLEDHPMQVIPTNWVMLAQERWRKRMAEIEADDKKTLHPMLVLAADIAQGGADSTVIVPLREDSMFDMPRVAAGNTTPTGSEVVERLLAVRRNNAMIVLDGTGGWGGATRDLLATHHEVKARMHISSENDHSWTKDMRYKFLNNRAKMWWRFREALDPESMEAIALPPDDALTSQLTSPHWGLRGNVLYVEGKDELRRRLGSSTDEADTVLMGWEYRDLATAERFRVDPIAVADGGWNPKVIAAQEAIVRGDQIDLDDPLSDWGAEI